jgi:dihydroorotase
MQQLSIIRPDDWHLHFRDNEALSLTVPDCARRFARGIAMPNLTPPVTDTAMALGYAERIASHVPEGMTFQPLMTLYLTDNTTPDEIRKASAESAIAGCKLYPAGATTNSDSGVTDIQACYPVFGAMQETGMILQVHGEVTDHDIDIFDREQVFIERTLT